MDAKEQFLIEQLTDTILSGPFSERDVLALLILLRRHAKQESVIREFGDFVAHREKDRGWLQKNVLAVKRIGKWRVTNGYPNLKQRYTSRPESNSSLATCSRNRQRVVQSNYSLHHFSTSVSTNKD